MHTTPKEQRRDSMTATRRRSADINQVGERIVGLAVEDADPESVRSRVVPAQRS